MKSKQTFISYIIISLVLIVVAYLGFGNLIVQRYNELLLSFYNSSYDGGKSKTDAIYNNTEDLKNTEIKEAYRFCWNHSLGPAILITAWMEDDQFKLHFRMAAYPNTKIYKPAELVDDVVIQLTTEQIALLRKTVNDNQFWKEEISKDFGLDGAIWEVEIKQEGAYYKNYQWSPDEGSIRNIGLCLVELSPYDANDIY